jgi:hypothetical protein
MLLNTTKLCTIRSFALEKNVTVQCVYKWIKQNKVRVHIIDGIKFIQIER